MSSRPARILWIATALSLAAWFAAGTAPVAHHPALSGALWVTALGLLLATGLAGWHPAHRLSAPTWIAAAIGLVALGLRLVALDRIPTIFSGNEAGVGLSALEFVRGTRSNLFDLGWWSFPSLYFCLQSWPLRLLGASVFGIRFSSSLIGALTVVATYAYARRAFGRATGLLSAAFLAFSGFHIHFSRLGLNNIWESLLAVLLAGGLVYAWKTPDPRRFLIPGLVLGLAQYFYVGGRMFLVLVPVWVILACSDRRHPMGKRLSLAGYTLWAAAIAALPLTLFYLQHPDAFIAPWRRVGLFSYWWDVQTVLYGDPGWWVLGEQLIKAPLGFVSAGLTEFYSGPLLTPLAAGLFVAGAVQVLRTLKDPAGLWMGLWLAGTMATVALSANPPAAQRYAGAAAAAAILVALGAVSLVRWFGLGDVERPCLRAAAVVGIALVTACAWEVCHYFVVPSAAQAFGDFNAETGFRVAESLREGEPIHRAFFFVSPRMGLADHETVLFLAPTVSGEDIQDRPDWRIDIEQAGDYALIFLPERADALADAQACFPGGQTVHTQGREGHLLLIRYDVHLDQPTVCSAVEPR
jgi:hypothetical protein